MKIIVAPDSYKGCLSAREVAGVIGQSLRESFPDATIVTIPLADGGEGTVEILSEALGGIIHTATVTDPLGRKVQAKYALKGDTAIIEVAEACGMKLLSPDELNPLKSPTAAGKYSRVPVTPALWSRRRNTAPSLRSGWRKWKVLAIDLFRPGKRPKIRMEAAKTVFRPGKRPKIRMEVAKTAFRPGKRPKIRMGIRIGRNFCYLLNVKRHYLCV